MIHAALDGGNGATVTRVRQIAVQEGLDADLQRKPPQRQYTRAGDGVDAPLLALACSTPPTEPDTASAGRPHGGIGVCRYHLA